MTTFAEMKTLVEAQTRRPEISNITEAAIRSATLRAHHTDFFPRDLAIGSLSYTPTPETKFYDIATVSSSLPRLRAISQLQGKDSSNAVVELLEYRDTDDLYDSDKKIRKSVYTLIGDTLRAFPQSQTGLLEGLYFRNPIVASGTYSSWIADTYPDDLAMWAAAIVWARTGFAEMAADAARTHIAPFKEQLVASHLLGNAS